MLQICVNGGIKLGEHNLGRLTVKSHNCRANSISKTLYSIQLLDDVMTWKGVTGPFVRGIHRSPGESPTKGQYCGISCFLWCQLAQTLEQTVRLPLIWYTIIFMLRCLDAKWMHDRDLLFTCRKSMVGWNHILPALQQRNWSNPVQWRHNERDGVSYHRRLDCLLNRLFRHRSKKISKLSVTGLGERNSLWPVNPRTKGKYRGKCIHSMMSSWQPPQC